MKAYLKDKIKIDPEHKHKIDRDLIKKICSELLKERKTLKQ